MHAPVTSGLFDVAVVGAGPGGSAAAWSLARRGFKVALLDADTFPRDKPCGDGLTTDSIAVLREMGLGDLLDRAGAVDEIHFHAPNPDDPGAFRSRSMPLAGKVIPRYLLDDRLAARACDAGAQLFEGVTLRDVQMIGGRCNLKASRAGQPITFAAQFVIGADGARSIVARKCGMGGGSADTTGVALRGYFKAAGALPPAFHIVLPLRDTGRENHCVGYGWLFPVGGNRVNVGVGYFPSRPGSPLPNPRSVFTAFLADLAANASVPVLVPEGPTRGGLLASGCDTERCYNDRALLVGDAAGLVDPLTGEGIDAALQSGLMAADTIAECLDGDIREADLSGYASRLRRQFPRRILQGDRLRQSYPLLLKVAEQAAQSDGGLFAVAARPRRASFGMAGRFGWDEDFSVEQVATSQIAHALSEIQTALKAAVAAADPVIWTLAQSLIDPAASTLRLTGLLLPGLMQGGEPADTAVRAGTALELCHLALEFHGLVSSAAPVGASTDKWTDSFVILAGDYLLGEGYRLLATLGVDIRLMVGRVAADYCCARIERTCDPSASEGEWEAELALIEATTGRLCGLSCAIGAQLSGASHAETDALHGLGRMLGVAGHILSKIEDKTAGPVPPADRLAEEVERWLAPVRTDRNARTRGLSFLADHLLYRVGRDRSPKPNWSAVA